MSANFNKRHKVSRRLSRKLHHHFWQEVRTIKVIRYPLHSSPQEDINSNLNPNRKDNQNTNANPNYITTQVILAFWLVLAYDLLDDRRINDDSARFQFFCIFRILNLNQSQFFAKHSNQSVRFILYRSCQCYFRACQNGEIWNKKAFFQYILIASCATFLFSEV